MADMESTSLTLLEVDLEDVADEDAFLAWWDEAEALLRARARLARATLVVERRGKYLAFLELPLAGSWKLVTGDRPWLDLDARRPRSQLVAREGRIWHREGVRDVTTSQLVAWMAERAAGQRDFVLLDALGRAKFAEKHLPGAVSLPAEEVDEASAAAAIGARDRAVVIYCGSYA